MHTTVFDLVSKLDVADTQEEIVNKFIDYLKAIPKHLLSKEILWELSKTCTDILICKKGADLRKRKEDTYIKLLSRVPSVDKIIKSIEGMTAEAQKIILNAERNDRMSATLLSALNFLSPGRE